jgi:D-aminoacyl-tRNA deacylase
LLAKTTKGSKPDFHGAMGGEEASRLYHYFLKKVQDGYIADRVKNGKFQAYEPRPIDTSNPAC